jgi:transcriptional regulator GlxA family with amidase domain
MDPRVLRVIDYIEANPDKKLVMDELAITMNISASRLRHLFSDQMGMSPKQYLITIRMEHARHLLENTLLNVKEVMTKVGINDESHFVRDFEKAFGLTPGRYRERYLISGGACGQAHSG